MMDVSQPSFSIHASRAGQLLRHTVPASVESGVHPDKKFGSLSSNPMSDDHQNAQSFVGMEVFETGPAENCGIGTVGN
jgi:hypothetical protein